MHEPGDSTGLFLLPTAPHHSTTLSNTPGRRLRQLLLIVTFFTTLFCAGHVCLSAHTYATVSLTAEEKNWIDQNRDKLVLWFNTDFPPIEFISENGRFTGMGADVVALVEKQLGVSFIKKASGDWNEHLAALESGECAVAPTIVNTVERQRFINFTEPYASVPVVIITGNNFPDSMTIKDLSGLRVAVVSGYASEGYLRNYPGLKIIMVPMPDVVQALRATSFGQVDAYVENLAVAAYYIEKEGIPNLRVAGDTPYSFAWSIGISQHYPALSGAVQKALASIPPQELESVRKRWVSLEKHVGWSRTTLCVFAAVTGFVLLLVVGLGIISTVLRKQLKEKIDVLEAAHNKIIEQTEFIQLAAEATQAGSWNYNVAKRTWTLSSQWFAMLGYDRNGGELYTEEMSGYVHSDDIALMEDKLNRYVVQGGQGLFEIEARFLHASGAWGCVLSKGKAVSWNPDGEPDSIIGLAVNIQTIKDAQEKTRQSEERYREIVEGTDNLVTEVDKDGRFTFVNEASRKIFGISPDECLGKSAFNFIDPADRERTQHHFSSWIKAQKESVTFENRQVSITGDVRDMLWTIKFSFDSDGGIASVKSIARDITEQKKAYRKLRQSEATMASIFKAAPIGIGVADDRRLTYANDRLCEMTGYPKDEFLGVLSRFLYTSDEEFRRVGEILYGQIEQNGTGTVETIWRRKDGREINVLISSTPISDQSMISGITFTALDITQRMDAEAALKESEAKYSSIFQESPIGIFHYTKDAVITECNKKFVEIIGSSRDKLIGLKMYTQLRDKKMIDAVAKSLESGTAIFQDWYRSVTGHKKSYLEIHYKAICDEQGRTIGGLGIVEDITEKKRAETELQRYQEHLEELVEERTKALNKEKVRAEAANRAKSEFLANMSHEIRTPLNAVTGFSELLTSLVADEKQKSYLKAIKTAGKSLMLLINDILDLSKIEAERLEIHYSIVDLNVLLKDIQLIFELEAAKKDLEFSFEISKALPSALLLDEIRLRQVLLNIVGNAVKFTEKGYIRLTVDALPHESCSAIDVHIKVEDTGIGISGHDLDTIFDSFRQQTNVHGSRFGGTGLGLTICKRLVEMMNGRIEVESLIERGSTFTIVLENVSVESRKPDSHPDFCTYEDIYFEKGKILVVDDIESNRIFLRELLELVNLDVLEAQNGQEAILIAPNFQPDAILMDIRMPVMGGVTALGLLKKNTTTRNIPVFAISASTSTTDQSDFMEKGFYGFIPKPVDVNRLLSELSDLLPVEKKERSKSDLTYDAINTLPFETRERLPELIRTLESEYLKQWKRFLSRQPIQEIKVFATELKELGKKYEINILRDYGKRLLHSVETFEVDSIKEAIRTFPDLLSQLKSKPEE